MGEEFPKSVTAIEPVGSRSDASALQIPRGIVAAFLGIFVAAPISEGLGLRGAFTLGVGLLVVLFCAFKCRNHLIYLLLTAVIAYIASASYSRHKISSFCESITNDTSPSQLTELSNGAGVEFHSSQSIDKPGQYYGYAADPFTMGDYACRVEFNSTQIISHRAFIH